MESEFINLVIVDDHFLFAEGVTLLLENDKYNYKITHLESGEELLKQIHTLNPDIILLDLKLRGMNGLSTLDLLMRERPNSRVIILSTYSRVEIINKCLYKGADAFLLKNVSIIELTKTMSEVLAKKKTKVFYTFSTDQKFEYVNQQYKITKREWEIVQMIKKGDTNQQISVKLHLSRHTIDTHRKNIMFKLKLKSPIELIKFLIEKNL